MEAAVKLLSCIKNTFNSTTRAKSRREFYQIVGERKCAAIEVLVTRTVAKRWFAKGDPRPFGIFYGLEFVSCNCRHKPVAFKEVFYFCRTSSVDEIPEFCEQEALEHQSHVMAVVMRGVRQNLTGVEDVN